MPSQFKSLFFPNVNIEAIVRAAKLAPRNPPDSLRVVSVEDVFWGGEKMLQLTFSDERAPQLMVYFPKGSPKRVPYLIEAFLGMNDTALRIGIAAAMPILFHPHTEINVVKECIMFIKDATAKPLLDVWSTLTQSQKEEVGKQLASIMLKLFQFQHGSICSTRRVVISGQFKYAFDRLVTPPFDQGPLGKMDPPPACPTPLRYLSFLALRVDRAMTGSGVNPEMIGWPQKPIPTKEEVQAIKDTWRDLSRISIFHTGGWYMSKTLSQDAACRVLDAMTQLSTGIYHDLDISRILVKFKADEKLELIIPTGWEHAFHAPKWSAARMPWWLVPGYYDPRNLPITSEEKREMSRVIYKYMGQQDRKWVICYAYGQAERFFEGLLKSHWMCRDAVEAGIKVLEARWMDIHPIIPPFTLGSSQMRTSSIPNQCRQDQQLQIHRKTDHGTDKDKVSVKGSAKR